MIRLPFLVASGLVVTVGGFAIVEDAGAQSMGTVSIYEDIDVEDWGSGDFTVVGWSSVEDNPPPECEHYDYYTTTTVVSPTNRSSSSQSGGTGSSAALSFLSEQGYWTIETSGYSSCTCGGPESMQWSSASSFQAGLSVGYWKNPSWHGLLCIYTALNCTSGVPTCAGPGGPPYAHAMANPGGPCPPTIKSTWAWVSVMGQWRCTPSYDQHGFPGGGQCY